MKLEFYAKIHNDCLKKSFALMYGLCTLKIFLPELDYKILKEEVKGISWCNVNENMIKCKSNLYLDDELKKALNPKPAWASYEEEYPYFEIYCDKIISKAYIEY